MENRYITERMYICTSFQCICQAHLHKWWLWLDLIALVCYPQSRMRNIGVSSQYVSNRFAKRSFSCITMLLSQQFVWIPKVNITCRPDRHSETHKNYTPFWKCTLPICSSRSFTILRYAQSVVFCLRWKKATHKKLVNKSQFNYIFFERKKNGPLFYTLATQHADGWNDEHRMVLVALKMRIIMARDVLWAQNQSRNIYFVSGMALHCFEIDEWENGIHGKNWVRWKSNFSFSYWNDCVPKKLVRNETR